MPRPDRVGAVYASLQEYLQSCACARIRIHGGKTQVWNSAGVRPAACNVLERIAQVADPDARVWRGSGETDLPPVQQGITVLGTPLGHPSFVQGHLEKKVAEQRTLLERIPLKSVICSQRGLSCSTVRLLGRTTFLRVVEPQAVAEYATLHDNGTWNCLCHILHISPEQGADTRSAAANLPLVLGGLGVRSASRVCVAAYWASWADCLPMIQARHPEVANMFLEKLEGWPDTPFLGAAAVSARTLTGTMGIEPPSWRALADGARPEPQEPDEFVPGISRQGWQHEAASRVERHFRDRVLFSRMAPRERALVRSQAGAGASLALTVAPTSLLTRIPPHLFRVVFLRRLRFPLPLSLHSCRCGRQIDQCGHHRAACARAAVLGRRGFALESAAGRICREAGGRVTSNVLIRDLDSATSSHRRSQVRGGR